MKGIAWTAAATFTASARVFYELLVGRRTFSGETQAELLERINDAGTQAAPQIDDQVPKELERICLKALSKRTASGTQRPWTWRRIFGISWERADVIDDRFTREAPRRPPIHPRPAGVDSTTSIVDSDSQPIKIVPKGLRAFDEHDADFFLGTAPGPARP